MRLVFVGTGAIGVPTLRVLLESKHDVVGIVTQPDKPVGRDQRIQAPPIKELVAGADIPILQPRRIKEESAIARIRGMKPEVIVVAAYGQILPVGVLEAPRLACINVHASLLPRWRGAAPIQAAIAAGDSHTGITIMYVDQGLDTGDILLQRDTVIQPNDTGSSVHDRLAAMAPEITLDALQLIERGEAPRIVQDPARATYAPKLSRDSGQIDWSEPAMVIERKIRAYNPWPGAFTAIKTESGEVRKLKVFCTEVIGRCGQPGEIVSDDDELLVAAGSGALVLTDIQLEGRKRMSASQLLRGNRWLRRGATFARIDRDKNE
jgi:methionyl-tRNA formyltransferase